eukprot:10697557-Alexandrium_andersonii.AAC.1
MATTPRYAKRSTAFDCYTTPLSASIFNVPRSPGTSSCCPTEQGQPPARDDAPGKQSRTVHYRAGSPQDSRGATAHVATWQPQLQPNSC